MHAHTHTHTYTHTHTRTHTHKHTHTHTHTHTPTHTHMFVYIRNFNTAYCILLKINVFLHIHQTNVTLYILKSILYLVVGYLTREVLHLATCEAIILMNDHSVKIMPHGHPRVCVYVCADAVLRGGGAKVQLKPPQVLC